MHKVPLLTFFLNDVLQDIHPTTYRTHVYNMIKNGESQGGFYMGSKRMGLARTQALIENLKREINWGVGTSFGSAAGSQVTGWKIGAETIEEAVELEAGDHNTIFEVDADSGAYAITLPTATTAAEATALKGWKVRLILTDVNASNDVTVIRGDASNDTLIGNVFGAADAAADAMTITSHIVTFDASGDDAVGDYVDIVCFSADATNTKFIATGYVAS